MGGSRVNSQARQQQSKNPTTRQTILTPSNNAGTFVASGVQTVTNLMVEGTSGLRSAQAGRDKNMDIAPQALSSEHHTTVDPAWLETNSPHNRHFIEQAY